MARKSPTNKTDKAKVEEAVPQRQSKKDAPKDTRKRPNRQKRKTRADTTGSKKNVSAALGNTESTKRAKYKKAEASIIMASMDYNPLIEVIKIAKGESLKIDHPFLKVGTARLNGWINRIERNLRIRSEEVQEMIEHMEIALLDGWTPIEMRNKNNLELLKYAHPQLKSSDVNVSKSNEPIEVVALTKKDITNFSKWFNNNY